MVTNLECPWCGDEGQPVACELQTRPTAYAVVCNNCGAQGPRGDSFERANGEWNDRAVDERDDIVIDTVAALDDALDKLALHARMVRDGLAAADVDVERAVALGGLTAVTLVLERLSGNE